MEGEHVGLGAALREYSAANRAIARFAAALFPHFCIACGAEGAVMCPTCLPTAMSPLRGIFVCPGCGSPSAFGARCDRRACASGADLDGVISAASYAAPVLRELLRLYKYERVAEAGDIVRSAFMAFIRGHVAVLGAVGGGATVVPVPMHPFREALRGFNQADMLAEAFAEAMGWSFRNDVLKRKLRLLAQANVPGERRRANAAGSVVIRGRAAADGRYLLIDDVTTTGATLNACAAALKAAGAGEVWAVTFLRG